MKNLGKRLVQIVAALLGVILILALILAILPIPQDELPAPENYGAGSSAVQTSVTGLQREFPPTNHPEDNPGTPESVELGYNLFFDPVLSGANDIACATCHHPDLGFSDGLPQAVGVDGVALARNTPSLWNVAYTTSLFWDGRVDTLENQALVPLHHGHEMDADANELIAELQAIPEYVALFEAAFGPDAITIDNMLKAIASFERTLITNNSPFDRYAAGELDALTPQQQRGFTLFRSAALRCFECHTAPTFHTESYRIIGVPDILGLMHDPGRAGIVPDGKDGAFKVPTLRNIALTAPYMHNGVFTSLEEVVAFYAKAESGNENLDPFMQGFELTDQESADLIAFLYALTDENGLPAIPASVPSGLPVVAAINNPARAIAAAANIGSGGSVASGAPRELTVQPGQTVQEVVDMARPGDTVLIPYGTYHERVVVNLSGITILGMLSTAGDYPIFDGQGKLSEAFLSSGNDFEIGYLHVRNYTDNGVLVEGVTNVTIHHIFAENTGTYGLYPVQSTNVVIEHSVVTGADDAGIYSGQSENVVIRDNTVYGNVLGIEAENTVNAEIYDNFAYENTNGILVVLLPQLTSDVSLYTKVYDNIIQDNNIANFAKPNTAAALMPPGAGLAIVGADHVEVYNNIFRGNKTAAIGIFDLRIGFDQNEIDVGPRPEHIAIHDNTYENNGYDADDFVRDMGISGIDIVWDVSGVDVRIDDDIRSFPPGVPRSGMPAFLYNIYWQFWNFLISALG
jgi:parallel beta-helix repeat protein